MRSGQSRAAARAALRLVSGTETVCPLSASARPWRQSLSRSQIAPSGPGRGAAKGESDTCWLPLCYRRGMDDDKPLTIRLPAGIHAALKAEAAERRVPMNAIIIELLRDHAAHVLINNARRQETS